MRVTDNNNSILNMDIKALKLADINTALKLIEGMIIKGEVTNITKDLLSLLTDKGEVISLPYKNLTGIMVSDILSFNVEKGDKGFFLTPKTSEDVLKGTFIQSALKEADLKPMPENKQMVVTLMENGLNIDKETLQNMSFYLSKLPNKDLDTALMLLKNNVPKSALLNENIINFLNGDIKILKNLSKGLEEFFSGIKDTNLKTEITNTFVKELNNAFANNKPIIPNDFKPLSIPITPKDVAVLPEKFQAMINNLSNHHENSKEFLHLAAKNPLELFEKIFDKETFAALQNKYSELNPKPKEIMEKVFSKLVTDFKSEDTLPRLEKNLKALETVISETITKLPESVKQNVAMLTNLEKNLTFVENLKNPLVMPFIFRKENGKTSEGELFVFKDKNGNKKQKDILSAYLSIDFSELGRVDSYVVSENKSVSITFTIPKENISLFKQNIESLNEDLNKKGYRLASVTYKDEFTKPFIENKKEDIVITNLTIDIKM